MLWSNTSFCIMVHNGSQHLMKSLDLQKYISRCQNRHPKWPSSKVMVKDVFLHNCGHSNTFANISRWNHRCFFDLLKGPDPSYPVIKFSVNLFNRDRDMAQSVILCICILERSRSSVRLIIFCTVIRTLPMSIYVKFRRNLVASCLDF